MLNNFWAAIYFNDLEIELAEDGELIHAVNADNLHWYMSEYTSEKDGSYSFYKAFTEPDKVFTEELPLLKRVELYVKKQDDFPKAVQMMRLPKMVVFTLDRYRVLPEPYAAVFICENKEGNRLLRNLEPPAHDEWDPERDKENGRKIYNELYYWIRKSLKSLAMDKDVEPEEIPELSRWLPEVDERDDRNPYLGAEGEPAGGHSDAETGKEIGVSRENEGARGSVAEKRGVSIRKDFARGEGELPAENRNRKKKNRKNPIDTGESGPVPRIDISNISFRARELSKGGERLYQTVFTSARNESGAIKIMAVGDDNDYPVEIEYAKNEDGEFLETEGPLIKNMELVPDTPYKLYVKLSDDKRYALGVE